MAIRLSATSTSQVRPWKWLRLRLEHRHDQSSRRAFHSSTVQDTLALGLGLVF
ncbi:MAG TPA: hypothetical protein VJR29_00800 [bacterium]|nr:hypothetical protein [bacterium]